MSGGVSWEALVTLNILGKRVFSGRNGNETPQPQASSGFWEDICCYYYALASETQDSKAHILEQLSCLLLCLSSVLSANNYECPDANTVSFSVRGIKIEVKLDSVQLLYDLLFKELNKRAKMMLDSAKVETQISGRIKDKPAAYHTDLYDIVLWLRCCIRILPLIKFHTGLNQGATTVLESLFWNLCSPNLVCMVLHSNQLNHRQTESVTTCENACWKHGYTEPFTRSPTTVEFKGRDFKTGSLEYQLTDIQSLMSEMLEVFVDEFILHPNLDEAFLHMDTETIELESFLRPTGSALCRNHIELSLEALFVHCLLSLSKNNILDTVVHKLFNSHAAGNNVSARISLPAAVLVLDILVLYKAPQIFTAHVLAVVSEAVSVVESPPTYGELPLELELPMCLSVFETAVKLYMKQSSLSSICDDHEWLENQALEFCLRKYRALQTEYSNISDSVIHLMWDENDCLNGQYSGSYHKNSSSRSDRGHLSKLRETLCLYISELKTSIDNSCSDEISSILHCLVRDAFSGACKSDSGNQTNTNVNSGVYLVGAILEMMGCSLSRIAHIGNKEGGFGHLSSSSQYLQIVDEILNSFGHHSRMQPIEMAWNNIMGEVLVRENNKNVGVALSYLAGAVCSEFQMGSELLCKGYIYVMKSLMCLLVLENGCNDILHALLEPSEISFSVDSCHANAEGDITQLQTSPPMGGMESERRSLTLMLVKHFQKRQRHISSDSTNQSAGGEEKGAATHTVECKRPCVKSIYQILGKKGNCGEDFSDLKDFIVAKKGKDYSIWFEKRYRHRKRKYHNEFFERMQRRKQLLSTLSSINNSHRRALF